MSLKLKLNTGRASQDGQSSIPPTPNAASATATPGSGGGHKLKISFSQPPTPATEQAGALAKATPAQAKKGKQTLADKSKGKAAGGSSKKRAANDDSISPLPKRPANGAHQRKFSIKLGAGSQPSQPADEAPQSAGGAKLSLKNKKLQRQPTLRGLNVKRPPPPRIPGHGYDSEDSEAEDDPAIQQAFVLRMEPGEDCDYIRDAIANGKIGVQEREGGAEVSMRFVEKDFRRAVITVRGRKYAAVLVDLPCIVETMKSWDKKGWYKVADISQMLLVLGRCNTDEEGRAFALPRGVDKKTLQYAHGLTPPMHWVRKRRFRKRLSYKTIANVEEEVERLLRDDELIEASGGKVEMSYSRDRDESQEIDDSQLDDEDGDAIETVENGEYEEYYDEEEDEGDADLEGNLQAMFDEDHAMASTSTSAQPPVADTLTSSPKPLADQAASFTAAEHLMTDSPTAATPAGDAPETTTADEQSSGDEDEEEESDEDDDDEADSPDVMDEDAAVKAAERNQQLEEVADLEREVEAQKVKVGNTKNQLLKERAVAQLRTLEEDLRVKRVAVFGLDGEGDDDGEEEG